MISRIIKISAIILFACASRECLAQCNVYTLAVNDASICSGEAATIYLASYPVGGESLHVYDLYKDGVFAGSASPINNVVQWTATTAGTYTAKIGDDLDPCYQTEMSGEVVITTQSPGDITITPNPGGTQFCEGTQISFSASGGTSTYTWMMDGDNVTDNDPTFSGLSVGNHTVSVSGLVECGSDNSQYQFNIKSKVHNTPHPSGFTSLCQNPSDTEYSVNVDHAESYSNWGISPGYAGTFSTSGNKITVDWSSSFSGAASISVRANGCGSSYNDGSTTVNVRANTSYTLSGNGDICSNAQATLTLSGHDTGVTYDLLKNSVDTELTPNAVGSAFVWTTVAEGTYTIAVSNKICPGDQVTGSVTVSKHEGSAITMSMNPSTLQVCEGDEIDFTSDGGSGSYHWTVDGNEIVDEDSDNHYHMGFASPGDHDVKVEGFNSCGISKSATHTIHVTQDVHDNPTLAGDTTTCLLSGVYSADADNALSYSWTLNPSTAGTIDATGQNANVHWSTTYSGHVSVIGQAHGCHNVTGNTIVVNVKKPANTWIEATPDGLHYCSGTPVTLTMHGAVQVRWYNNIGAPVYYGSPMVQPINGPVTYIATTIDSICYFPGRDTISLTVDAMTAGGQALSNTTNQQTTILDSPGYPASKVINQVGNVVRWEYSLNDAPWVNAGFENQTVTGTSSYMSESGDEVQLRAIIKNGVCPEVASQSVVYVWNGENRNYIRTFAPQLAFGTTGEFLLAITDPESITIQTQYFDGLGRNNQNLSHSASPLKRDVVQHKEYNKHGLEPVAYLPYTSTTTPGKFKVAAKTEQAGFYSSPPTAVTGDEAPYAVTEFERSPINRVLQQGAPGTVWQPVQSGTSHTIKKDYQLNESGQVMLLQYDQTTGSLKSGISFYPPNTLYCVKTRDEHDNDVLEYQDIQGRTVCKKVKADDNTYAITYYVYDDLGNLRLVLPPEAVQRIHGN